MLKRSLQTVQTADHADYADWYFVFFKGQINQNFDIFSFNPIYLLSVDLVSNKHILKFQVNWT